MNFELLARRLQTFDATAYRDFGEYFGARFKGFFIRRGLTPTEAEDLAVSCVTDVALAVGKYQPKPPGTFQAWAFRIAKNLLADWWRRHPGGQLRPTPASGGRSAIAFKDPRPEREQPNVGLTVAVQLAVASLRKLDQEIVYRRELGGMESFRSISMQLGISEENARVRHLRALTKLKKRLREDPGVQRILERKSRQPRQFHKERQVS